MDKTCVRLDLLSKVFVPRARRFINKGFTVDSFVNYSYVNIPRNFHLLSPEQKQQFKKSHSSDVLKDTEVWEYKGTKIEKGMDIPDPDYFYNSSCPRSIVFIYCIETDEFVYSQRNGISTTHDRLIESDCLRRSFKLLKFVPLSDIRKLSSRVKVKYKKTYTKEELISNLKKQYNILLQNKSTKDKHRFISEYGNIIWDNISYRLRSGGNELHFITGRSYKGKCAIWNDADYYSLMNFMDSWKRTFKRKMNKLYIPIF